MVSFGVWFLRFSVLNLLLSTCRAPYQHICQVLPSETAEGGDHWRQKGKLKGKKAGEGLRLCIYMLSKICHCHMIKIGGISFVVTGI